MRKPENYIHSVGEQASKIVGRIGLALTPTALVAAGVFAADRLGYINWEGKQSASAPTATEQVEPRKVNATEVKSGGTVFTCNQEIQIPHSGEKALLCFPK
jgi:hypothetical protein